MMNLGNSLADTKLEYTYEDGSSVVLIIEEKSLGFEWLSGPFKGTSRAGLKYNCRELGEDQFLINWHDLEGPSFATLLIDNGAGKVHGSAIIGYTSEEPVQIFDEATISSTSRIE